MKETLDLQMGEPVRMEDIDKEEAPWSDLLWCMAGGETGSTEGGLVLERSRGHSSLIPGGKAGEMGTDDGNGQVKCGHLYSSLI